MKPDYRQRNKMKLLLYISSYFHAAKTAVMKEYTSYQHMKDSYWFSEPLSEERMSTPPPKQPIIFEFDIE